MSYLSVVDFWNLYFTKLISELDFLSVSNLIFTAYVACKNQDLKSSSKINSIEYRFWKIKYQGGTSPQKVDEQKSSNYFLKKEQKNTFWDSATFNLYK